MPGLVTTTVRSRIDHRGQADGYAYGQSMDLQRGIEGAGMSADTRRLGA